MELQLDIEGLNRAIKRQGRTRSWIADQCGISEETLRSLLQGRRKAKTPFIKLLARVLEVSEDEISKGKKQTA